MCRRSGGLFRGHDWGRRRGGSFGGGVRGAAGRRRGGSSGAVGRCVGAPVGSSEGMRAVGGDDGASVGASDGLLDGASVGAAVGRCVGAPVSSPEGLCMYVLMMGNDDCGGIGWFSIGLPLLPLLNTPTSVNSIINTYNYHHHNYNHSLLLLLLSCYLNY